MKLKNILINVLSSLLKEIDDEEEEEEGEEEEEEEKLEGNPEEVLISSTRLREIVNQTCACGVPFGDKIIHDGFDSEVIFTCDL